METSFICMFTYALVSDVIFRICTSSGILPSICRESDRICLGTCVGLLPSDDSSPDIEDGDRDGGSGPAGLSDVSVDCIGSTFKRICLTSSMRDLTMVSLSFNLESPR